MRTRLTAFPVAAMCAVALAIPQPARADDDAKKLLIAAAAIAGVAALAHHNKNHDDGNHYNDANRESEYERGYRDGLYHADYNNYNNSDDYAAGFDSGNHDRNVQVSHNQDNRWDAGRHGSPDLARRACTGEASARWGVNPRDITPASSRETGTGQYEVVVAAGYHRANCGADGQGNVRYFEDQPVNTNWGHHGGHGRDEPHYSTANFQATTALPCSWGRPSHNQSCAAGIHRGDPGSASISVQAPNGRERILNFDRGDVTTPNGGRLTWGKDGDDWYIGIDDREYYIVPEAAVYGG